MSVKMGDSTTLTDGTTFNSTVLAALDEWNGVLRNVQFVGTALPPGPATKYDGNNEMVFSDTIFGSAFGRSALAVTVKFLTTHFNSSGTQTSQTSDILFNSAFIWDSYRGRPPILSLEGAIVDLRRVALHELGHLLGLGHPEDNGQDLDSIMNGFSITVDGLVQDDIDGGQFLYGEPGPVVRPANDDFADATVLASGLVAQGTARSTNATREIGEPAHVAGGTPLHSLWWRYTAPFSGTLTAVTAGTNFDTVMAAYTGSTLASLQQIAFNNDVGLGVVTTSALTLPVTADTTYFFAVDSRGAQTGSVQFGLSLIAPGHVPVITSPPGDLAVLPGASATFAVSASGPVQAIAWQLNGLPLPSVDTTLVLPGVEPDDAGLVTATFTSPEGLSVTSAPAILGLLTNEIITGAGQQVLADTLHPNGNVYDQVLLTGKAVTVKPDPGQVVRVAYIDFNGDIVQIEMSGAGTLSLERFLGSLPASPANYNQPTIRYSQAFDPGIVIVGADETTNLSITSVGRLTAFDPTGGWDVSQPVSATNDPANNRNPIFRDDVTYDGIADLAFIAISSTNGKFGGLRAANANFAASRGFAGVYAPGVEFLGPVFISDIIAFQAATPVIELGRAADVRITGGDLDQFNGRAVRVSGITQLVFTEGTTSHNLRRPAQRNKARLEENGVDVTTRIVVGP